MPHDTTLIATLAASLAAAFMCGFLAVRMGLPAVLGYLIAGIAIGPFTPGFVGDVRLAGALAEVGVILLMFGVGMHFPLNQLMAVGGVAVSGAVVRMAAAR